MMIRLFSSVGVVVQHVVVDVNEEEEDIVVHRVFLVADGEREGGGGK